MATKLKFTTNQLARNYIKISTRSHQSYKLATVRVLCYQIIYICSIFSKIANEIDNANKPFQLNAYSSQLPRKITRDIFNK